MTIIKDMVKTEGVGAFFKGLTPKVSTLINVECIGVDTADPGRRPQTRLLLHLGSKLDPLLWKIR